MRSHLHYTILLWGNHNCALNIFKLQNKAVRILCGVKSKEHCKA